MITTETKKNTNMNINEVLDLVSPNYTSLNIGNRVIKTRIIELTPTIAKMLLDRNKSNRPLNKGNIAFLMKEIKNGNWQFSSEAIKIDDKGNTLDGQHRCHAVINTGISINIMIVSGLDSSVFTVLDTGRKRLAADSLSIHGVSHATLVSATIRIIVQFDKGSYGEIGSMSRIISNQEMVKFYDEHPEIAISATDGYKLYKDCNGIMSPSVVTAFHYLLNRVSPEGAEEFLTKLCTGVGLEKDSAINVLRNKLIKSSNDDKFKLKQSEIMKFIIIAWNKFRAGEKCKVLKLPADNVVIKLNN